MDRRAWRDTQSMGSQRVRHDWTPKQSTLSDLEGRPVSSSVGGLPPGPPPHFLPLVGTCDGKSKTVKDSSHQATSCQATPPTICQFLKNTLLHRRVETEHPAEEIPSQPPVYKCLFWMQSRPNVKWHWMVNSYSIIAMLSFVLRERQELRERRRKGPWGSSVALEWPCYGPVSCLGYRFRTIAFFCEDTSKLLGDRCSCDWPSRTAESLGRMTKHFSCPVDWDVLHSRVADLSGQSSPRGGGQGSNKTRTGCSGCLQRFAGEAKVGGDGKPASPHKIKSEETTRKARANWNTASHKVEVQLWVCKFVCVQVLSCSSYTVSTHHSSSPTPSSWSVPCQGLCKLPSLTLGFEAMRPSGTRQNSSASMFKLFHTD